MNAEPAAGRVRVRVSPWGMGTKMKELMGQEESKASRELGARQGLGISKQLLSVHLSV